MKFQSGDFHSHQCPPLGDNPRTYARLAEFVNLRLAEMIAECPTVYAFSDNPTKVGNAWLNSSRGGHSHTAKLVEVRGCLNLLAKTS